MRLRAGTCVLGLAFIGACAVLGAAPVPASSPEFFETRIRPLLAGNCYGCHTQSALGGLRVDSREALLKGGASGPALAPGEPEKSLLIRSVQQTGEIKMPKGGKLKPEQVEDLVAWVKAGAEWPVSAKPPVVSKKDGEYVITPEQRAFWSFQPLHKTALPTVSDEKWVKTNIDRFVLARLEKEGLKPVRPAAKRTLIRRVTLDLTGLPPTPQEIEDFEKDESPEAFAKVVDRLLASPHYGERWGRIWLDVARYGEDDYRSLDPMRRGYAPYPNAYLYRDWVIQAFNNDLPFDQFVKAQIAADYMDEKIRHRMLPALGFLGQGPWFYDNGAVEVTRADERHDRIDVVSRGFLGLTAGCARCHDHKYDPIPQKDYYSLAGVFASTNYHEYAQAPRAEAAAWDAKERKIKDKEKLLGEIQQAESLQLAETLTLQIAKYMQAAWRVAGEPKDEMPKVVEEEKLDFELLQRFVKFLAKPPRFYPYLEKWQAMVKRGGTAAEAKKLAGEFQTLVAEVMFEKREMKEENEIIVAKSLPGTKKKERAMKPSDFVTNDDFCPGCGLELKTLAVDRMNLWTDVFQRDLNGEDAMQNFRNMTPGLLVFRGWGLERQLSAERRGYMEALRNDIETARKALPPKYPFVHGVSDAEKPLDLPVSLRGNPYNLGETQPRHFLSILADGGPEAFQRGSGRLELAEAIIRQPIALRVFVNRIWKAHFGTGIVDSPSNFGFAGERPTNAELLEYLAQTFSEGGLSAKKLHREILLSSVYQLSAENSQENFAKDSGNRLYWRFDRRRMDAEQIRDSLLTAAGNLDEKMFGPSKDLEPAYTRRTIYGKVSRYHLDEYLALFDFSSPMISAEKRFATNVPLQRLFFMNSDFVQQQAELLARRVAEEADAPAKIQKSYLLLYGRNATPKEVEAGIEFLRTEPMREYEERKAKEKEKKASGKPDAEEPEPSGATEDKQAVTTDGAAGAMPFGAGMMAGMPGAAGSRRGGAPQAEAKPLLPVSVWGRYAKILMSSPEFTFIN
jgi:mono/diheme cytochrome c family protein